MWIKTTGHRLLEFSAPFTYSFLQLPPFFLIATSAHQRTGLKISIHHNPISLI